MVPTFTNKAPEIGRSAAAAPASSIDPPVSRTLPPNQLTTTVAEAFDLSMIIAPSHDLPIVKPFTSASPTHPAAMENRPVNESPANAPSVIDPHATDASAYDPLATHFTVNDPPVNEPLREALSPSKPPALISSAGYKPSAKDSLKKVVPTQDPQIESQQAFEPLDPMGNPSASFAIPVVVGHSLSGVFIRPSSLVVAGSTIVAGAPAVQVQGHQVFWDPLASKLIVDGQPHALATANLFPPASGGGNPTFNSFSTDVNGHDFEAATVPGVRLIDGQLVTSEADLVTAANTPVALHTNGDVDFRSSTVQGIFPSSTNSPLIFSAESEAATVLSNGVAIAGKSLTLEGQAVALAGTPLSLGVNGLVMGASTIPLPTPTPLSAFTAAGQAMSVLDNGNIVVSGTTLIPDAPAITIAGTPISLGTNGLIVGSSTVSLPPQEKTMFVTIGGQILPLSLATNEAVIAGATLGMNQPPITMLGAPVSLGTHGLVIGTSTTALPSSGQTGNIGGYIFSGFNGGLDSPSATDPVAFTGSGSKLRISRIVFTVAIIPSFFVC